jgi:hypothetical protein
MTMIAKMKDGTIVEVVRSVETVSFSEEKGWIFICFDFDRTYGKRSKFKWIRSNTEIVWMREYCK